MESAYYDSNYPRLENSNYPQLRKDTLPVSYNNLESPGYSSLDTVDQEASHLMRHARTGRLLAIDIYNIIAVIIFIVFIIFGATRQEFRDLIAGLEGQLLSPWLAFAILIIALFLSLIGAWIVARRHIIDQSFKLAFLYALLFTSLIAWVYFFFYYGVDAMNFYLAILLNILAILISLMVMFYSLFLIGKAGFLQILLVVTLFYFLFATLVYSSALV